MVAHAFNPRYLGGRYPEDYSSRPAQANSYLDLISTNKLGGMMCTHDPNYEGDIGRKIWVQAQPSAKMKDPIQRTTKARKVWEHSSSCRVPY
jgi:hypothetical protein